MTSQFEGEQLSMAHSLALRSADKSERAGPLAHGWREHKASKEKETRRSQRSDTDTDAAAVTGLHRRRAAGRLLPSESSGVARPVGSPCC